MALNWLHLDIRHLYANTPRSGADLRRRDSFCHQPGLDLASADHRTAVTCGNLVSVAEMIERGMGNQDQINAVEGIVLHGRARILIEKWVDEDVFARACDDLV